MRRFRGVKVLKAVSSPVRLNILSLLSGKGGLSYTELINSLKMNPSRDAGRFAYHLKSLLKANLVEADVETRKYQLTEFGKIVVDAAEEIERRSRRPKRTLIRTSRHALEDFDTSKIVNSLVSEANVPVELAQRVAREAENRLTRSKPKYLTAPMVREVVNEVLIEKGLEEYRHRLTRLGLPVHEVASIVRRTAKTSRTSTSIQEEAGRAVLNEYVLLNVLPRDIADAHLSGAIYIDRLSEWVLKPNEIVHDSRFFFRSGLDLERTNIYAPSHPPPADFESALSMILSVVLHSAKEIGGTQLLEYFNVFLAPFAKSVDSSTLRKSLQLFLRSIGQHANVSLGLELSTPDFIARERSVGPLGKSVGRYDDYVEETRSLARLIVELLGEANREKPWPEPKIVVKLRPETLDDHNCEDILVSAHGLALEGGNPLFASLLTDARRSSVYSPSGCVLSAALDKDWETDTLRTGNIGTVTVNLPMAAYECKNDKPLLLKIIEERVEMAARALDIKHKTLRRHGQGLMPLSMRPFNGDQYYRLDFSSWLINFVGLKEAASAFGETPQEESLQLAEELTTEISRFPRLGKRRRARLFPAVLPAREASRRLAKHDIERFGVGRARFSGSRRKPFYSDAIRFSVQNSEADLNELAFWRRTRSLTTGGTLVIAELGEEEYEPGRLLSLTKTFVEKEDVELLTYNRDLTYCRSCRKSLPGLLRRCPFCDSSITLIQPEKI